MTASTHSSFSRQSGEEERIGVEGSASVSQQDSGGEQDIDIEQTVQQPVSIIQESNKNNLFTAGKNVYKE